MIDRSELSISSQYRFGDEGEMETDEQVETDLLDWEVVEPEPERPRRVLEEQASEFGIDDRSEKGRIEEGSQSALFVVAEDGQQSLGGGAASDQCLWE